MMFLRDFERGRKESSSTRTVGVALFVRGRRYFFPGATEELGLAHPAFPKEEMDNPSSRVEFGEADGSAWRCIRVLKSPDYPEGSG